MKNEPAPRQPGSDARAVLAGRAYLEATSGQQQSAEGRQGDRRGLRNMGDTKAEEKDLPARALPPQDAPPGGVGAA